MTRQKILRYLLMMLLIPVLVACATEDAAENGDFEGTLRPDLPADVDNGSGEDDPLFGDNEDVEDGINNDGLEEDDTGVGSDDETGDVINPGIGDSGFDDPSVDDLDDVNDGSDNNNQSDNIVPGENNLQPRDVTREYTALDNTMTQHREIDGLELVVVDATVDAEDTLVLQLAMRNGNDLPLNVNETYGEGDIYISDGTGITITPQEISEGFGNVETLEPNATQTATVTFATNNPDQTYILHVDGFQEITIDAEAMQIHDVGDIDDN